MGECHTEYDEIVDTTVTEHCEEVITTTCQQTSTHTRHHSAVVGTDSKIVATVAATAPVAVAAGPGVVSGYSARVYGKREADAEAEPTAEADADAGHYGYAAPAAVSAPLCESVPVKKCNKVPVSTSRKVP